MEQWLQFVRGPLFIMTFLYMILALMRLFVIQLFSVRSVLKNTNDTEIDTKEASRWVLEWLVPVKHLFAARPLFSVLSFVWHILLIIVPLFLLEHLMLWQRGAETMTGPLGISFAWLMSLGIPKHAADGMAALVIVGTIIMFVLRMTSKESRAISEPMDYVILLLLLVPFVTGFLASHPTMSPIGYTTTMLIHVLGAELVFVLMPTTKLSHAVLFPFARLSTHIFWKMPEGAGEQIARELYGEEAKV